MSKKRFIAEISFGAALLIAGLCSGYAYGNRNLGVQGELRDARNKLNHYLVNEAMTQSEMTTLSEFQLKISCPTLSFCRSMESCNKSSNCSRSWCERYHVTNSGTVSIGGGSISVRTASFIWAN